MTLTAVGWQAVNDAGQHRIQARVYSDLENHRRSWSGGAVRVPLLPVNCGQSRALTEA